MIEMTSIPEWMTKQDKQTEDLPAWWREHKKAQRDSFVEHGLPSSKNERWKYADIQLLSKQAFVSANQIDAQCGLDVIQKHRLVSTDSILLVMINGKFAPDVSDMSKLPEELIVCSLHTALSQHEEKIKAHLLSNLDAKAYPFASLNASHATDGLFIYVPKNYKVSTPIHLLSLVTTDEQVAIQPANYFVVSENSELTLVEEFYSRVPQAYMLNAMNTVVLAKNAKLNSTKIQNEGQQGIHIAGHFLRMAEDSLADYMTISAGGIFARDEICVLLSGAGAVCKTAGFYHLHQANQFIDHHLDISHAAPNTNSEMLYKGILERKTRAVFNGRLHVEKDAQKIVAYQANHNLLLENDAEVYSKPELEIYADDVKCKHGATTGQLDQEAMFYMQSRGISKNEATKILIKGFAAEVLDRIDNAGIKKKALEALAV